MSRLPATGSERCSELVELLPVKWGILEVGGGVVGGRGGGWDVNRVSKRVCLFCLSVPFSPVGLQGNPKEAERVGRS